MGYKDKAELFKDGDMVRIVAYDHEDPEVAELVNGMIVEIDKHYGDFYQVTFEDGSYTWVSDHELEAC